MKIRLFTVPNMLTLANLLAGCAAIIFTLQYHAYETAFWLIIAAAVFDFFDGFAARLLNQSSPLGVQLDSLADDVTFGLAPAVVMYDLYLDSPSYYGLDPEIMGWLKWGVLIIAAFSVLRLAKFNIDTTQSAEFEGLPTPANALMLMSLALLSEAGKVVLHQESILVISLAASLLLISPIRMFALKFKSFGIKGNELRYGFIVAAIALIILVPAYSLLAIIVLYIALSTLRWLFIGKSKR
ncbi:MAG: CDP-diacylglycerol--serine O-phosphatidyltransferase [Alistipes sp.]|nr:CDP-diacylglycerol--serine O-phosphatidyltransferase [Alistipes sp.]MBR5201216.1 CDP-diacylglycerol--serine O-phosphatidyltransferase [Alistipes sp.]